MKTTNKLMAECLGTFWLVLGGCGTAIFGGVGFLGVAIAFGLTVVTMAVMVLWIFPPARQGHLSEAR